MISATDEADVYGIEIFDEGGAMTFTAWLQKVDEHVCRLTGGRTADDFADWHFADAFGDGVEPNRAAVLLLSADMIGRQMLELAGIEPEEF